MRVILLALAMASTMASGCLASGPVAQAEDATSRHEAYLWNSAYPHLVVELHHAAGEEPTEFALQAALGELRRVTGKERVTVETHPITGWAETSRSWSDDDLLRVREENTRRNLSETEYGREDTAIIEAYLLRGDWKGYNGVTIMGRAFVFRADEKDYSADPHAQDLERHTLVHELGHALGLVDCGLPMVTPRAESGCHSDRDRSVMSSQTTLAVSEDMLTRGYLYPWQFDEDDVADILAFQRTEE